jgi:two-component sensor histidine kinase
MAQTADLQKKADVLRRQNKALADFGLEAFCNPDLDRILHHATELVSRAMDIRLVKILELLPGGEEMLIRAGVNWKPGVVGHVKLSAGDESPAGHALRCNEPVISHDTDGEKRFRIPPVLKEHGVKSMVNVIIAGETAPYGVLEVDATDIRPFDADDANFLRTYANLLAAAIDRCRKQEILEKQAEQLGFVSEELRHRVKNLTTLTQSIAMQTSIAGRSAKEYRDALAARLMALGRAEDMIFQGGAYAILLQDLVDRVLEPYRGGKKMRIVTRGEPVSLAAGQGRMLGLALHELATNAAKYGALSKPEGHVDLGWTVEGKLVRLIWQEQDGPPVSPPKRRGFGSRVIERVCSKELGGKAQLAFPPDGVKCEIEFPLAES